MSLVAFTTFAILRAPQGDDQVQGFFDRLPNTFEAAEHFEGFVGRSTRDPNLGLHSWGDVVHPRFFKPSEHGGVAFTLSLWLSLEAVNAFAYSGVHGEALSHRLDWFLPPEWPSYAAWWVPEGHTPNWHEASARVEHLHDHGPTSHAFTFKSPFGPGGEPVQVDRSAVRDIAKRAPSRRA